MSITNGDRVEIVGLVARTDLNGSFGTVERLAKDGEDRWNRDPRSGPRDGPPTRDDRFAGKGGKGDGPPPRSGFGDRNRDGDDRFGALRWVV